MRDTKNEQYTQRYQVVIWEPYLLYQLSTQPSNIHIIQGHVQYQLSRLIHSTTTIDGKSSGYYFLL